MVRSSSLAFATLAFGATVFATAHADASFYPPDYVIEQRCQTSGPVEVCAINQRWGGFPRLIVRYRGELQATQWGRLSAYVRLNGRDGIFRLENFNYVDQVVLGDPAVRLCWVGDANVPDDEESLPGGGNGWCAYQTPGGGGLQWEATPPPEAESALFFYARNAASGGNAWDVEVAVTAEDGRWDSRGGQNYSFRFE